VELCLSTWQLVTQTQLYIERKAQYLIEYHTLVVLYEMVKGIQLRRPNDQTFTMIPRNEIVRRCLHQRKDMLEQNQKNKWTAKQMTNTHRLFHMFIGELQHTTLI
jgi:hypothetical protein